ncbi:MAG: hypothetical protein IKP29_08935 [Pseudobutyrivibrio sp.]|nr:hypothetical protein [Pseudobutyrivibrio sp.]
MKKIWEQNKILLTFFSFVLCIVACYMLTTGIMGSASANNTVGNTDYSLATVAQAATIYVNTLSADAGVDEIPASLVAGNAGGFIGHQDDDNTDNNYSLCEHIAANTISWSYDALGASGTGGRVRRSASSTADVVPSGKFYGYYGYALSEAGLDEVGTQADATSMRMIIGIAFIALYVLSVGMSSFFNLALSILQAANPFKLFAAATKYVRVDGAITPNSGSGVGSTIAGALGEFASNVVSLYDLLYDISLVFLIPVFIALAFFTWLVINKGTNFLKIFKPLAIRIIFIAIGVPLMFGVYDAILTAIRGAVTADAAPATTVVGSLFCDFESWVESDDNIKLPTSGVLQLETDSMSLSASSSISIRSMCYAINKANHPTAFTGTVSSSGYNSVTKYMSYDNDVMSGMTKPTYTLGSDAGTAHGSVSDVATIGTVIDMLQRYANGTRISSGMYASYVGKNITSKFGNKSQRAFFNISSQYMNYDSNQTGPAEYKQDDAAELEYSLTADEVAAIADARWSGGGDSVWSGSGIEIANVFANGNLQPAHTGTDYVNFGGGGAGYGGQALSTMAMYNYLNSKFTSSGIEVTSPNSTNNSMVAYQHYAVTSVGNGFLKVVFLADGLVLLACTSIIGYGYGFAMMIGNFKALAKIVPAVLSGMLGSMRGIASAFVLMFALICEVVGTILLFDVSMTIVYALYAIIEAPAAALLSVFSGLDSAGGNLITSLLGVISTVMISTICFKLLQWRQAIVGAITASCTQFVNKMLGTNVNAPDLDSAATNMGGKMLTAGLAAASVGSALSQGNLLTEGQKSTLTDTKDSLLNGLTNKDGKGLSASDIANNLGVKDGNGTGVSNSKSSMDELSNKINEMDSNKLSRSGNGVEEADMRAANDEELAQKTLAAGQDDFEREMGISNTSADEAAVDMNEEDTKNPLVGDEATEETAQGYLADTAENRKKAGIGEFDDTLSKIPEGTTKTTSAGVTTTQTKKTNDDGSVSVTTTKKNASGKTLSSSKLLANADGTSELTNDTFDGNDKTHEVINTDANGESHITREIHAGGKKTLVEQDVTFDDAGHVSTVSTTKDGKGNVLETAVETMDVNTGSKTIEKTVHETDGTLTTVNERHTLDGAGHDNVVFSEVHEDGSRIEGNRSVSLSSNKTVSENTTSYSSQNAVVNRTSTHVVTQGVVETTTTEVVSGGQTVKTVDSFNTKTQQGTETITNSNGSMTRQPYQMVGGTRQNITVKSREATFQQNTKNVTQQVTQDTVVQNNVNTTTAYSSNYSATTNTNNSFTNTGSTMTKQVSRQSSVSSTPGGSGYNYTTSGSGAARTVSRPGNENKSESQKLGLK